MSRKALAGAVILIALAGPVAAATGGTSASPDTCILVPESLRQYYAEGQTPDRLAYAIDLWHDACLKADAGKVSECEGKIFSLLSVDLSADQQLLGLCSPYREATSRRIGGSDSVGVISLDSETYAQTFDLVKAKVRLYQSIAQSSSFSNKYRLLWDYIELTRRQLGLPRLRLALEERPATGGLPLEPRPPN
jgi:hypothetical protein